MDLKIYQHISLKDTPKCTQIGIFGLKIHAIWQPRACTHYKIQGKIFGCDRTVRFPETTHLQVLHPSLF
jgi:hypothetical protein